MSLTIVNHETHAFADLEEVANFLGHGSGFSANLDAVSGFKVLSGLLREILFRLKLKLNVLCGSIGYPKLQLTSSFIDSNHFFTPFTVLPIVKLVYRQGIKQLMRDHETGIFHQVFSLAFETCVVFFLAKFVQN